jgi:hypothetical protein
MRRLISSIFMIAIVSLSTTAVAQTEAWWANNVHWDGVTSWKRYLIYSPGFFGPNALPVPELSNGSIDSSSWVGMSGAFHFSKGDNTQNLRINANARLAKNISLDFYYIPYEWYKMDHATKTARHIYYQYYYNDHSDGDAYLNMNIQMLNKWRKYVHLALRIGYRYPTSSSYGAARYTDAPGYFFDLSAAKPFGVNSPLKFAMMIGFYAWQTNSDIENQDDALQVGAGLEYNKNKWRLQLNACAYYGYENRDDPVVARFYIEKKMQRFSALLHFQQGLQDFDYSTIEGGFKWQIKK